ncbi:MAG: hypothetical protein JWO22_1248 [Frankiales bacterium]|nr:hypothetical protein [Frankiales bacterium]
MSEPAARERVSVRHTQPLYPRLLQLKNVHPNAWQRAALGEGMAGLGILLSLADLASAWSIVVLPLAVAGVVKAHDVVTGMLPERPVVVPRPGSDALWALVERGGREADDVPPPFALLETDEGVQRIAPAAGILTGTELADALREGLRAAAPTRAVLVRAGGELEGYEGSLAHGLLAGPSLDVLAADLPPVLPLAEGPVAEEPPAAPGPEPVRVVEPAPDPEPVVVRAAEPDVEPVGVRVLEPEPDISVRIIPAEPQPEPQPEPEPADVGSDALWALLWAAQARIDAGAEAPFALLEVVEGEVVEVHAPGPAAALLTADEQAGALRSGLLDLARRPDAPSRVALVYNKGAQLVGYEPGLASGIVVAAGTLALVPVDVPNIF